MKRIIAYIRREEWSPYTAGVLLGIVGVLAVWLSNSLLGASGAFENLAGLIGKAVAPSTFDNVYFNFIMPPEITWSVILLVGVFFGGMLGAATSGTLKWG
ncbi:MAG: YeeE/YedE family protein, partial [Anaerolineae bacterium]|nr:YeeE/YedE family protein [Anaerolineae bacterium]